MDTRATVWGIVGALSLYGCSPGDDVFDEELEFRSSDAGAGGGGRDSWAPPGRPGGGDDDDGGGGWIINGLHAPDVSGINPWHPLSSTLGMSETNGLLCTDQGKGLAEYIVECALGPDQSVTKNVGGQTHVIHGEIGLAPQWENGSCDDTCQKWISACLLARTNVSEQNVDLWLQADHPAIGYGLPAGVTMTLEGAFYGNLFWTGSFLYYCEGAQSGNIAATRDGRTCSTGGCGFSNFGSCTQVAGRCTMGGPNGDVPINCREGKPYYDPQWPTIATYLPE
ncbi:MAG: hypothetical protein AAGF11_18925 [Myxococcota bacterium]